jgi:hypothetical protein
MASDELPVWRSHGQEAKRGETGGQRMPWNGETMGGVSSPVCVTEVSLIARGCLIGATPGGQPWTSAVTLPPGRNGLSARRMAMLSTFRAPSLCRHVHRALWRSVWLDVTPIIPATACHQRNYVGRYSRYNSRQGHLKPTTSGGCTGVPCSRRLRRVRMVRARLSFAPGELLVRSFCVLR